MIRMVVPAKTVFTPADTEFHVFRIRQVPAAEGLTLIEHSVCGPQDRGGEMHGLTFPGGKAKLPD